MFQSQNDQANLNNQLQIQYENYFRILKQIYNQLPQCTHCQSHQIISNKIQQIKSLKFRQKNKQQVVKQSKSPFIQEYDDNISQGSLKKYKFKTSTMQLQNQTKRSDHKLTIKDLIDQNSAFLYKFKIDFKTIQMVKGGQYFQILGKVPISQRSVNTFMINKTKSGMIKIAIADRKYLNQRDSFNKIECFYYSVKSGIAWQSGRRKIQGKLSKENEQIVMEVKANKIQWKVDGQIRAQMQSNLLQNQQINWIPFIAMFDKGDKITWQ